MYVYIYIYLIGNDIKFSSCFFLNSSLGLSEFFRVFFALELYEIETFDFSPNGEGNFCGQLVVGLHFPYKKTYFSIQFPFLMTL